MTSRGFLFFSFHRKVKFTKQLLLDIDHVFESILPYFKERGYNEVYSMVDPNSQLNRLPAYFGFEPFADINDNDGVTRRTLYKREIE